MSWSDAIGNILTSVVNVGGGMIMQHQLVQDAKGQANDSRNLANSLQNAIKKQAEADALANQANANNLPPPKSNTALYIGLGVGGVVLIGAVIFAVTRD